MMLLTLVTWTAKILHILKTPYSKQKTRIKSISTLQRTSVAAQIHSCVLLNSFLSSSIPLVLTTSVTLRKPNAMVYRSNESSLKFFKSWAFPSTKDNALVSVIKDEPYFFLARASPTLSISRLMSQTVTLMGSSPDERARSGHPAASKNRKETSPKN